MFVRYSISDLTIKEATILGAVKWLIVTFQMIVIELRKLVKGWLVIAKWLTIMAILRVILLDVIIL